MAKRAVRKKRAKKSKRAKRMKSEQTDFARLVGSLAAKGETDSTKSWYINAPHILSMMNRKAYHQVNSDGSIKMYGLQVSVFNMVNGSTNIKTGRLGYFTENATRAWHFARKDRYEEAGFKLSDLGYGSRLRFAMDSIQSDLNQSTCPEDNNPSVLAPFTNTIDARGEWDWSDVIITPPSANTDYDLESEDLVDSFKLHLIGDHTTESTNDTLRFTKVGMVQSWMENTRGWSAPGSEQVIQPENPLAFARMSESASLILTEEVADEQKQSPPYSNTDDDDATSIWATYTIGGNVETAFPNVTTNDTIVLAPGGVAKIEITNNDTSAAYPFVRLNIIEL